MIEKKLLKAILNKKFFLENQNKLVSEMFPKEFKDIFETISKAHLKYNIENLTVDELAALHYSENPALTIAAKNNLDIIFTDLAQEEPLTEEIANDVMQMAWVREMARQVAQEAISIINGEHSSLSKLTTIINDKAVEEEHKIEEVPSDLESIIEGVANNIKWLFNIEPIKNLVPGIGPALFTIFAARPNAGKDAWFINSVAAPGGFAWQGAQVDVICNEEPAIRTKMRAVCAATGMTDIEVMQNVDMARPVWDNIKNNIHMYDLVGMTIDDLEAHVLKTKPDILIVNQLDKIKVTESLDETPRLRLVYTRFREILKKHQIAGVGVSQLSAEAHNKMNVDYSMLENSKTGKAAEADLIFCCGCRADDKDFFRQINISKNKITGKHDGVILQLQPQLSRYIP